MCDHLPSRWGRCWVSSITSFHLCLSLAAVNRLWGRRWAMYAAGTTACCAVFVHPGSPERGQWRGLWRKEAKEMGSFFSLTCHYIADSKCYLNLLTDVTSPAQHIPPIWGSYPCTLNAHSTIPKLLTRELMSQYLFCCCCCVVFFFPNATRRKKKVSC